MKKRRIALFSILSILLAGILAFGVGCGAYSNIRVRNPQTDTNFIVLGNGSLAVQYGPYVYFVNGTRDDFSDPNADMNRWGNVVQGGIYRARLHGQRPNANSREWELPSPDDERLSSTLDDSDMRFNFELVPHTDDRSFRFGFNPRELDEDYRDRTEVHERRDFVDNTLIAPKTVDTMARRGIFIFHNHIYFASPSNRRNRQGQVMYEHIDFLRMRLDGTRVERIFTTPGPAAGQPFAFHAIDNRVYLVSAYQNADELLNLVTLQMRGNRVGRPHYIATNVDTVHMPFRSTFDANDTSVRLEDFIFFTRIVELGQDNMRTGNLIVVASPCGRESFTFQETGSYTTIEAVRDNSLFFTRERNEMTEVAFTNLHNELMQHSPRYAAYQNSLPLAARAGPMSNVVFRWPVPLSDFTTRYYFRPTPLSAGYMLGISSEGAFVISYQNTAHRWEYVTALPTGPTPELLFIQDQYMYYLEGEYIFRIHMFRRGAEPQMLVAGSNNPVMRAGAGLFACYVAGYLMFFSPKDEWTTAGTGYTHFMNVNRPGSEPFFVGTVSAHNAPTHQQIINYLRQIDGTYIPQEPDYDEDFID